MKNKKYKFVKYSRHIIIVLLTLVPLFVYSQVGPGGSGGSTLENPLTVDSFSGFVEAILNTVVKIGVPVAAIAIIFSGFLFVTAQGNPEKLATAKTAFIWSVVGTAVLLGAWVFAQAIGETITAL